jgi:CAAX prenyl protease-like protein
LFTAFQGRFGDTSHYWVYLVKVLVAAWVIFWMRPLVPEMRWALSWEAMVVGIAVFVVWVGLDAFYPKFGNTAAQWNPFASFPSHPELAWFIALGRAAGSTLVVPPLEEVFYRSFMYRYLIRHDFQNVPLNEFRVGPFLLTALIFGFAHFEWLAGILCALAYHGLILRKNRLGDAITAHAITNFLLGCWVIGRGAWQFW